MDETSILKGGIDTNPQSNDGFGGLAEFAMNIEDINLGKPFL